MSYRKLSGSVIGFAVAILLVVGCGGPPAAAPPAEAPAATLTPIPPAATPTPPSPPATWTPLPTGEAAPQAKGELIHETITSQTLAGNLVGDPNERGYFVYLPPGYADGNKRYPVVYILHPWTAREAGGENVLTPLRGVYEKLLGSGTAEEMILVFPDGSNKFGGSYYLSSPTIGDFETYLARDLVARIDADYRTIPDRDSRGITGCSMGGDGAMHLALTFPDVYSVVASMSAKYDFANNPDLPYIAANFKGEPHDFVELYRYRGMSPGPYLALAAAAAPNPDKPPLYMDMPFEYVDGEGRVVPEVMEKIGAVDEVHDLEEYLEQPVRLRHILLYHAKSDQMVPADLPRSFDQLLTERGVEHEYVEVDGTHCQYDMAPVLQYLSNHLVGEQSSPLPPTATSAPVPPTPTPVPATQGITVEDLSGIWQGIDPTSTGYLQLNPDGTYRWAGIQARLDTSPASTGEYRLEGTLLTFLTSTQSKQCAGQNGSYRIQLTGPDQLETAVEDDPCQFRTNYTRGRWERVAP
jgi:pimeloyl-ACP methyl ester carboxylesterase